MHSIVLLALTTLCVAGCISVVRLLIGAHQVGLDLSAEENMQAGDGTLLRDDLA